MLAVGDIFNWDWTAIGTLARAVVTAISLALGYLALKDTRVELEGSLRPVMVPVASNLRIEQLEVEADVSAIYAWSAQPVSLAVSPKNAFQARLSTRPPSVTCTKRFGWAYHKLIQTFQEPESYDGSVKIRRSPEQKPTTSSGWLNPTTDASLRPSQNPRGSQGESQRRVQLVWSASRPPGPAACCSSASSRS